MTDGWAPPPGMTMRVIDPTTGMLAGAYCPEKKREYFKPGTEPTDVCTEHVEEQPVFDTPRAIQIPDPIRRGASGIGQLLRKIFHF